MKEETYIIAEVKVPKDRDNWIEEGGEFLFRRRRFKKWWRFWEDNYEDVPCEITNLKSR